MDRSCLSSDTGIPKSDTRKDIEQGRAEYPPCFEAIAQPGMEEGLLRMIVDCRFSIDDWTAGEGRPMTSEELKVRTEVFALHLIKPSKSNWRAITSRQSAVVNCSGSREHA